MSDASQTHLSDTCGRKAADDMKLPDVTEPEAQMDRGEADVDADRDRVVTLTRWPCWGSNRKTTESKHFHFLLLFPPLPKTVRQSFCPLFLTFHRTCFTVKVPWPSKPRGGTGRRGVWQVILRACTMAVWGGHACRSRFTAHCCGQWGWGEWQG